MYDVTSCLAAWSHVPSGGSPSREGLYPEGGMVIHPVSTDI